MVVVHGGSSTDGGSGSGPLVESSCTGTQVPTYPRHIRIRVPRVDCLHNEDSMTTVLELRRPTMCTLLGGSTQQSVLLAGEAVKRVGSTSTTNDARASLSTMGPIHHQSKNLTMSNPTMSNPIMSRKSQSSWWHPAVGNYSPSASNGTNEIFMGAAE
ncbi:hypothetical protein HZH66_003131 [Vespula vulgaris]|uniref:Uncharacterized protein n=1 Tax=Vespula vulgaris TaxID=7454 RepID=A0A834KIG7_VESVU|nr:hypothetical protein HZH66_003131 [Vespula vulgaris]